MKKFVVLLLALVMAMTSVCFSFAEVMTWGTIVAQMRADGFDPVGARVGSINESFEIDVDFTVVESIALSGLEVIADEDGNITGYTTSAVLKNVEQDYYPVVVFAQYDENGAFLKATITECGLVPAGTAEKSIQASITTGSAAYVRAYMWNGTATENIGTMIPLVIKAKTVGNVAN
ncbi:MAG: hypothetical protein II359_02035 [Clostridia bacterium]|nr:hypothetical protein [Clostridia bacterium]